MIRQLTIDGREELVERTAARAAPLTAAQRAILRAIPERGTITPAEAGRIVHEHRTPPCERCRRGRCGFTSTDGHAALKRLGQRGLVRRIAAGVWAAYEASSDVIGHAQRLTGDAGSSPARGPKGARIGDVVLVEHSRWRVIGLDPARREVIAQLIGGSGALRRFRARRIVKVERARRR